MRMILSSRAVVWALTLLLCGCAREPRAVLYCAQDRDFAEPILTEFQQASGISVAIKFDTEANKSVALFEEIVREANRPRCDVHWNNEILATIRLQKQGLLAPYSSPAAAPFPDDSHPTDRTWQAFAARARVLIVNTDIVAAADRPTSLFDLADAKWKGRVAMAKPLFGTTATHAVCLFDVIGDEKARAFFRSLHSNEVKLVAGNKQVAERVGAGDYAFGITDTDDAMLEVKAGRPVAIVFPDADGLGTLFLPNTLALIRNGPNPEHGQRLIDYLLRPEVERRLAQAGGYQIPLNPQAQSDLPPELAPAATVRRMRVDFERAAERWEAVQAFLRDEFAR